MIRAVGADDQAMVRDGLAAILGAEPDLEIVGTASEGIEAVAVAERLHPDVVVMDVRMPGMDGIEATRKIVAPDLAQVLVLTTSTSTSTSTRRSAPARRGSCSRTLVANGLRRRSARSPGATCSSIRS